MVTAHRVVLYESDLNRAYRKGAGDWMTQINRKMFLAAVDEAPRRTGQLKASHRIDKLMGGNQWQIRREVSATAPYAAFVHQGTGDLTTEGAFRSLKPYGTYRRLPVLIGPERKGIMRPVLHGQEANNWLERACARVAVRSGGGVRVA